jgi:hypothetical protein
MHSRPSVTTRLEFEKDEGVGFADSRRKSIQLCRLPFDQAEGFLPPNRPLLPDESFGLILFHCSSLEWQRRLS